MYRSSFCFSSASDISDVWLFWRILTCLLKFFVKFYSTFWSSILKPSFVFVNDSLGLLLSIICCCFMMSWRTCEILLWCSLVSTFWSLISNSLLIVHVSFQLLFFISLWYFRCFFEIRWLFWRILTSLLKFLWNLLNFLIIDLATVVCVCKWFVGTPSFHQMLFLFLLANMWDSFAMFSSHYLLITNLKSLVDCPCIVPAFVFHQPLIFQMFDFFEESWLVCWSFLWNFIQLFDHRSWNRRLCL